MLPPYNLYWFRIDNKHMTEPWLDQELMESAYKCALFYYFFIIVPFYIPNTQLIWKFCFHYNLYFYPILCIIHVSFVNISWDDTGILYYIMYKYINLLWRLSFPNILNILYVYENTLYSIIIIIWRKICVHVIRRQELMNVERCSWTGQMKFNLFSCAPLQPCPIIR